MSQANPSIANRLLARLEKILKERHEPQSVVRRGLRGFRTGLKWVTIFYVVALLTLLGLLGWWGERSWLLTPLLYLPPQVWLLPLVVLTPLCLFFNPKLCWWHAAVVVWMLFGFMRFHWAFQHPPASPSLKIISANIGQRRGGLSRFIEAEEPDVIALQDAANRGRALGRQYPGYNVASRGEFVLASKYSVKSAEPVTGQFYGVQSVAARFELDFHGRNIAVYVVHMPTPRPEFNWLRGRGFLVELIGGKGIYSSDVRRGYAQYWNERIELAKRLNDAFRAEREPFVVVGDFNTPDHGYIHRLLGAQLTDAFAAKGRGYGLTFPGTTRNPLTLFGPWLRLDYIFAGAGWRPVECRVEPRQPAQHRAVVATLELKETN